MVRARSAAATMAAGCLCFRSRRLARLITRTYDEALRPLGIQATQLTLLNAIALAGDGGTGMPRLVDLLGMESSTLSRNLRLLHHEGFIALERQTDDRRVRVAKLTEKGDELLEAALPLWKKATEQVATTVGVDEAADMRRQLDRAASALAESGSS